MEIIVGTAGHIDHGKTALVKALTGVDADRLPEEKKRGITIDIGFAEMTAGDAHFGFVDVPGHERFVKNMLAGASGIDLVLLVVAADEGVMPQTREHFEICRLLGVTSGLIALTKSDMVDADTLDLARLDVSELVAGSFLENAPMVAVSSRTGIGIDELRGALVDQSREVRGRSGELITRLPIDRSFSMKGFGTVVTGTLASGELREGDELELLPPQRKVRIRGLQSHGEKAARVASGRRVAVNLGGVDHADVVRGMTLVEAGALSSTQAVDTSIEVLSSASRPLRSRQRVRVHIGTAEALARVQVLNDAGEISQGDTDLVQIRAESSIVAVPGERFIIRSYSPQSTIAGGIVIDNSPARHRRKDLETVRRGLSARLAADGDVKKLTELLVAAGGPSGVNVPELQAATGIKLPALRQALSEVDAIVEIGGHFITGISLERLIASAAGEIRAFHEHEPLSKGMPREKLRERVFSLIPAELADAVLAECAARDVLVLDKETVRLASHSAALSAEESAFSDKILFVYDAAGLEVEKIDEVLAAAKAGTKLSSEKARKFLQRHIDTGEIVKVSEEFYFSARVIDELRIKLISFADATSDRLIDVPTFKEIAGVSRKYAIPLLEYFDRVHVTARAGDKRVIL